MKRKLNRIRVAILKFITVIASLGFLVAGCAVDSKSPAPLIVCAVCAGWLVLMAIANRSEGE